MKTALAAHKTPFDVQAVRVSAAAYRDALATEARALSSPPLQWPASVKGDVDSMVQSLYKDISTANNVSQSTTQSELLSAWGGFKDSTLGAPAQAIRTKLGLSSDTNASCGITAPATPSS